MRYETRHPQQNAESRTCRKVEELEARGEGKSGNKAWLRRRPHAAIVRDHLNERADERAAEGA